mgnify:CR=1 FL=1
MKKWRIEDSEDLYNINGWGASYFSINEKGNVAVTPKKDSVQVDLKELMDELQLRDVAAPVLVRFPDILDNRIEKIAFRILTDKGISETSFADIAQKANVTRSLVQHYFPKKDIFIADFINRCLTEISALVEARKK